ncbi:DUF3895 domain-containing protein [Metabacillus sediminilitoris]|uniref:DUF3895 domain-containing protein n=1 Tax=Metabacillus sediminilitoris TaxID=2567941 RepID=A0A4S4C3Q4_9BACI|nr:DUF3895 domain-containing protein [Metabacillus sediminilitoris]QGQ45312.1 DUF3895 domain-containing protein [Metabacillus sediminilitoris]THF82391.1 DUF3895 domain-containing protein [Metabacillus sediminilitoris]
MDKRNLHIFIDQFLENNNKVSAIALCDHLIQNHGLSNKNYSTGRPKIYIDVVLYLEKLLSRGVLSEVQRDRDHCIYEVSSKIPPVISDEEEENKANEEQLSLF